MPKVKRMRAVTAHQMAKRICDRKDNVYDKRIIENIVDMYMEECYKSLLTGESTDYRGRDNYTRSKNTYFL